NDTTLPRCWAGAQHSQPAMKRCPNAAPCAEATQVNSSRNDQEYFKPRTASEAPPAKLGPDSIPNLVECGIVVSLADICPPRLRSRLGVRISAHDGASRWQRQRKDFQTKRQRE